MNLRLGKGKVPIYVEDGYIFLPFPDMDAFCQLYNNYTNMEYRKKYYHVLLERTKGKTYQESALLFGLSRERVRQIERKFMRLITKAYFCKQVV